MKLNDTPKIKLSTMTKEHLAEWCHVQPDDVRLPTAWDSATEAILRFTGLLEEEADEYAGLVFAAIALTSDMIYNPGMHVDNEKINQVVMSFISLHDYNLLPREVNA